MADVPPNWGIYFLVPEINAAVERVKANGGKILNGPMEVPGGDWIVNAMDPQGAAFSLPREEAGSEPRCSKSRVVLIEASRSPRTHAGPGGEASVKAALQHRRPATAGATASAEGRLRLHRRRRRARGHAARELPGFRRRDVPAALCRGDRRVQSPDDGARRCDRLSVVAGAGRQQPAVLSARRGRRRPRRRCRPASPTSCPPCRAARWRRSRPRRVAPFGTSSIWSAATTSRKPRIARARRPDFRRSSSPSTPRSRACASATSETARRNS